MKTLTWNENSDQDRDQFIFAVRGEGFKYLISGQPINEKDIEGNIAFAVDNDIDELMDCLNLIRSTHIVTSIDTLTEPSTEEWNIAKERQGT